MSWQVRHFTEGRYDATSDATIPDDIAENNRQYMAAGKNHEWVLLVDLPDLMIGQAPRANPWDLWIQWKETP